MSLRVTETRFEELVDDALDSVPDALFEAMDNVVVLIADRHPDEPDLLGLYEGCLLYTSPSPRDRTRSRMPSSA